MNSTASSDPTPTQHFIELFRKFETAMLVTRAMDGSQHGRPMALADVTPAGTIWFITSASSTKCDEIRAEPRAFVTAQTSSLFATVSGMADVVRERGKLEQIWKESYRVWFDGKDDPDLVLLRFTPSEGEYWDHSGARGVKYAFRAVAAYIQGEKVDPTRDEPETHAKVNL
jgi:general stress protein 26